MKKVVSVLLIISIAFLLVSCRSGDKGSSEEVIHYNLENDPESLDPQIASDYSSGIVIMNIFEGLVRLDENANAIPGAACNWTSNESNTSFTFNLRDDIKWADEQGTNVTSEDFVYGIKRALSKDISAPYAKKLYPIKNAKYVHIGKMDDSKLGIRSIDGHTLVIDLEYPYEDFPKLMALSVAMPCNKAFFESTSGQYGLKSEMVLGNGPFKIKSKHAWNHDKYIQLGLNPNYNGENKPLCAGVNFSINQLSGNALESIKKGDTDASILSFENIEDAKKSGLTLKSFEGETWGLCFNLGDKTFINTNIRKSFVQALSREYILSVLPENFIPAKNIINNSAAIDGKFYREAAGDGFLLSENQNAKQVLEFGLKEIKAKSMPSVTIICMDDAKTKSMVSNMLEMWNNKFGHYFNMLPMSKEKLTSKIKTRDYQIALAPIPLGDNDPLNILSIFKSENEKNPCNLRDKQYDAFLAGVEGMKYDQKVSACQKSETYLNEQAVFCPLCYEVKYFACGKGVNGIIFHPYNFGIDFIKTSKSK